MQTTIISTRIAKEQARQIEKFAKEEDMDRSTFLKRLVHRSLDEYRVENAFQQYKEGKISLGRAAELAEKSMWEMLDLMKKHEAYLRYDVSDLEQDIKTLEKLKQ